MSFSKEDDVSLECLAIDPCPQQSLCEAIPDTACNIFTFNHHTKDRSTSCFGGIDHSMHWSNNINTHCISGCRGDACKPAPPPTPPPLPPGARMPVYVGPRPSVKINASAGLRPVPGVEHITVYNATTDSGKPNPFGLYNHGPIITKYDSVYFMSWYNSPKDENRKKRSVFATSTDGGVTWSAPSVLFPEFTAQPGDDAGEENGPWSIIGADGSSPGRLYTQSGTQDAGEHHEGIISVARRVYNATTLGPPFWLNRTTPSYCHQGSSSPNCQYPTYLQMDNETRADMEQLLASFVRTTVPFPDAWTRSPSRMAYNERSVYAVPGTDPLQLVLLLRGGARGSLKASFCSVPHIAEARTHRCTPHLHSRSVSYSLSRSHSSQPGFYSACSHSSQTFLF